MKTTRAPLLGLFCCLLAFCRTATASTGTATKTAAQLAFPAAQTQVWQAMQTAQSPWLPYLIKCAGDSTGQMGIENQGTAAAYAYLYTGQIQYAANAWAAIKPYAQAGTLPAGNNNNSIRIYGVLYSVVWLAIGPTLSASDQALYVGWMNGVEQRAESGFLSSNANGLCGEYLGACLWKLASAAYQPSVAAGMLTGTWKDSGVVKPFGGLAYNPAMGPTGSARNCVWHYVTASYPPGSGTGCWLEGKQYRDASLFSILFARKYINRLTGTDCFPEVTAALPQMAADLIGTLTTDVTQGFSWGDDEFPVSLPGSLHPSDHITTACMLAEALGTSTAGNQLRFLISLWTAKYGYAGISCRAYLAMNPLLPATDFRGGHAPLNGTGLSLWRSGWGASDSAFAVLSEPNTSVNHTGPDRTFRSFSLWRKGEWVTRKADTYGGMGTTPDGNNTVVVAGIGDFNQRGEAAYEAGANYLYHRAETSGPLYDTYFKPAPPFVFEQTGSVLFVHGANGTADVAFIADRINADNPALCLSPAFPAGWRAYDAGLITAAETPTPPAGPLQWIVRSPVQPTITSSGISWQTAGGQQAVCTDLSPILPGAVTSINEAAKDNNGQYLYFVYGSTLPSERQWQTRETWSDGRLWHFLLHVLTVTDKGGVLPPVAAVSAQTVSGALVEPAGDSGVLCLFSSDPSSRLIRNGFTVTFTAANKETDLYLPDLDSSETWTVTEDSRTPQSVTFGSGGVGRAVFYDNRGKHSLTITAN